MPTISRDEDAAICQSATHATMRGDTVAARSIGAYRVNDLWIGWADCILYEQVRTAWLPGADWWHTIPVYPPICRGIRRSARTALIVLDENLVIIGRRNLDLIDDWTIRVSRASAGSAQRCGIELWADRVPTRSAVGRRPDARCAIEERLRMNLRHRQVRKTFIGVCRTGRDEGTRAAMRGFVDGRRGASAAIVHRASRDGRVGDGVVRPIQGHSP